MKVHQKSVFWILFLSIQGLASYYAETDDEGYYYSVEYEPLNYKPESKGSYDDSRAADKDHDYHYAMDLALVFDSSYTITSDGWSKIKQAAKRLTNNLDVSPDGTHVSMLVYSTNVDDYYIFDDNTNKRKISKLIDGLTYYGEWSRLDRALSAIPHHVFSPFNGARSGVPKVVVIFTDGKLEDPSTSRSSQADLYKSLARSVDNLHREDVVVYGVATGASDSKVFDLIAGDRSRIFNIYNIEKLINSLLNISIRIYNGHFHKEEESNEYASSSAAVESTVTLTTTIDMAVIVTADRESWSTRAVQASKSAMASPIHQVSSSVGLAMASKPVSTNVFANTSLTLAATTSNSKPLNQHTSAALSPTAIAPSPIVPTTAGVGTVNTAAGGASSVLPSQTLSGTAETSRPLSTIPSIKGSSGGSSVIPNIQPGIASFGTDTTTVTVTATPTPQIIASPTRTSASGSTSSSRDQIQDDSRNDARTGRK